MSDKSSKKPEKLASAVYVLSGFFDKEEPLRWKMRSLASDLVSCAARFEDHFNTDKGRVSMELKRVVSELGKHLLVAKNAGLVSPQNHEIISQEIVKYQDTLTLPDGVSDSDGMPVLALSGAESEEEVVVEDEPVEEVIPIKDKTPNAHVERTSESRPTGLLDSIRTVEPRPVARPRELKEFGAVSVKKNNRKGIIIGLLKRKKEIMIKDVSPLISGCSEKTIQRELLSMVKEGILKKDGEKRWSRYSLA